MTSSIAPVTEPDLAIAPWPQVDRYPIIVGTNLTFSYIASVMRTSMVGYRMQFVDLLSELLDHEPHGFSEMFKRAVAIASARYEVVSADPANPEAEAIAEHVRAQIKGIPFWTQSLYRLAFWGEVGGVGAEEVIWRIGDDGMRWVDRLQFIHSRRLSYPHYNLWDLHVWDQGTGGGQASDPSDFGIRVGDYPDKFVVHSPSLRAEYPTREGIGRVLTIYFAFKRLVMRCTGQDFERFVKPWVIAYYSTSNMATGKPRVAGKQDIAIATAAMQGAGAGSLAGLTLPDSIRIELLRAVTALSATEFLGYLDRSITMVCQGQDFTSSPGEVGARAASVVSAQDTAAIQRFCAAQLAESLQATLVRRICGMNYHGQEKLWPLLVAHVEAKSTPAMVLDNASKAVLIGAPVDGKAICKEAGIPLVDPADSTPVRLVPLAPVDAARVKPDGTIEPVPEPIKAPSPASRERLGTT